MSISHKNILFGLIFTSIGTILGYFIQGHSFSVYSDYIQSGTGPVYTSPKTKEVYSFIEKYYYGFGAKDRQKLEDSYLSALATSLGDRHTNYFNQTDSEKFVDALSGDFQGIGAVIQNHRLGIRVMKVLPLSPAEKSGLKSGDIITHVNNEPMVGVPVDEAVNKIRGPKGSTVLIKIITASDELKRELEIIRDTVVVPSVDSRMLSGSIGFIEISLFGETTAQDVEKAITNLSLSGAKAFIIDGRNNGGGYLESAVDILSLFFEENTEVIITKGTHIKDNQIFRTKNAPILLDTKVPVVMLINSLSASATEIMAGAFQDLERALIVGENSYGKGSVQTPFYLSDGSLIKITTAKWFTPKERSIDEKGILPDKEIHFEEKDFRENYDRQLEAAIKIITLKNEDTNLTYDDWKKALDNLILE